MSVFYVEKGRFLNEMSRTWDWGKTRNRETFKRHFNGNGCVYRNVNLASAQSRKRNETFSLPDFEMLSSLTFSICWHVLVMMM